MPRSLSKSQIDKLGERLAAAPVAADEDLEALELLRSRDYAAAMDGAVTVLKSLGVMPGGELTMRLKTNATIIDKLRRGTKLSSMQDIAGVRVARSMSLTEQDELVARLTRRFVGPNGEPCFKPPVDRRVKPSSGYRAVHLVVRLDDCPVEIQVRTFLQHLWANAFEFVADSPAFGRGIRYDGAPARERTTEGRSTSEVLRAMMSLSEQFAAIEKFANDTGGQIHVEATVQELLAKLMAEIW